MAGNCSSSLTITFRQAKIRTGLRENLMDNPKRKIFFRVILGIFAAFILLLAIGIYSSARIQYVACLDIEKAELFTPQNNYPLKPLPPSGLNFPYSKLLVLCSEADNPDNMEICFNGVGVGSQGYLTLRPYGEEIDLDQLKFPQGESFYQVDDRQKKALKLELSPSGDGYRAYAYFLIPAPLSAHQKIGSSYYREMISAKEKDRIDKGKDQFHQYQLHFIKGNKAYRLKVDFHLVTRAYGLVFFPTSRWINFQVPLPF